MSGTHTHLLQVTALTTTGRPRHRDTAIGGKLEGRRAPPSGVCGRLKAATQRWRSGGRLELDHAGGIALAWIGHGRRWVVVLPLLGAFFVARVLILVLLSWRWDRWGRITSWSTYV
jgi:hypothetical protein